MKNKDQAPLLLFVWLLALLTYGIVDHYRLEKLKIHRDYLVEELKISNEHEINLLWVKLQAHQVARPQGH